VSVNIFFLFCAYNFLGCSLIGNITVIFPPLFYFSRGIEDFDILHGDVQGLPDTVAFLQSLSELVVKHTKRERKAAANLFNWEVLIISSQNQNLKI